MSVFFLLFLYLSFVLFFIILKYLTDIIFKIFNLYHRNNLIYSWCFNKGKGITSRIEGESVSNMTKRSIPIPRPPVGGIPDSNARRNSSSTPHASSFPCAFFSA